MKTYFKNRLLPPSPECLFITDLMTKSGILVLVILFLGSAVVSLAEDTAAETAKPDDAGGSELVALERFLDLSDAELEQIEKTVQRIRKMSPEEKTELREKIRKFRALPDESRRHLRRGWHDHSSGDRAIWQHYMHRLPDEVRKQILEKMNSMTADERHAFKTDIINKLKEKEVEDHEASHDD